MWFRTLILMTTISAVILTAQASSLTVHPVTGTPSVVASPFRSEGRVQITTNDGKAVYRSQWPGVYFKTSFTGSAVYFEIGHGDAIYHVLVDDRAVSKLVKPAPGLYVIDGLAAGRHTARVEVASENQAGPIDFGGFFTGVNTQGEQPKALERKIEFIGDSHTVGYGNTSSTRECTDAEVWLKTDTSQAFGPLTASHYHADYRINAISGRGVVRNYNGFLADTLPQAYPFVLFDKKETAVDSNWRPQVVVISLGTNDFSTALNPGEKWKTRDDLYTDYEKTYVAFVRRLRVKYPSTFFVLAATDMSDGEIQKEVRKVIAQLNAAGAKRVAFAAFNHLEFTACNFHPSLADDKKMAQSIIDVIDAQPGVWTQK